MALQATTRVLRLAMKTRPVLSLHAGQRTATRTLFYTQRKRPSTAEENLIFFTGLGSLAAMIGLVCISIYSRQGFFSVYECSFHIIVTIYPGVFDYKRIDTVNGD